MKQYISQNLETWTFVSIIYFLMDVKSNRPALSKNHREDLTFKLMFNDCLCFRNIEIL